MKQKKTGQDKAPASSCHKCGTALTLNRFFETEKQGTESVPKVTPLFIEWCQSLAVLFILQEF